jgi:crossover junction endodeoxyribonuclease RusA
VTTRDDTRPRRPRTPGQAAALARLRDKGLGLAPLVEGGRIVRSRRSDKQPASRGGRTATTAPQVPSDTLPRQTKTEGLASAIPGSVFELVIPAPCPFLNANQRLNRWEKAPRIKAWRNAAYATAIAADFVQGIGRLQIDAYVIKPVANRFDPANYQDTAKATTDGLIDYGLAVDDNRKIVDGPFMRDGGKGSNALRIVVTVLPLS